MSRSAVLLLVPTIVAAWVAGGCEEKRFDAPDQHLRIELADSLYSPALFDTIAWASEQDRISAGNLGYADYCRRCHGPLGQGGPVEVAGRQVQVPSLVRGDWRLHDDIEQVRRRIFTGHTGGMPSWGIHRLTPREIDAIAFYLLEQLRPEMLDPEAAPTLP